MKPLDFYRLGRRLSDSADTDAEWRTVVGRLYYGLHHETCCRYFRENPNAPPLPLYRRRTELIERFDGEPGTLERDISQMLRRILNMRNVADYELKHAVQVNRLTLGAEQLMHFALIVADGLLAALEDFSPGEAPDGCDCPTARV